MLAMNVAAIGCGVFDAYRTVPPKEVPFVESALRDTLNRWDPQGYAAYLDFAAYVGRGVEGGLHLDAAAGSWIIWNLKGGTPSDSELAVAEVVGSVLVASLAGAWDARQK